MKDLAASPNRASQNRRAFLQRAAAATACLGALPILPRTVYGQAQAPAAGSVLGANNRLRVAYIGTGKQGMLHLKQQKKSATENNIVQVAACDLYAPHLAEALETAGLPGSAGYRDHRKLLERQDVDAVVISTVDNWHAQVTLDALAAGKHVFCEKPMTRYLAEAFAVHDAVKQSGKTYLIGSQGCMDKKWHQAAEWVKAGKLGPLVWGQGSYCRNNPRNSEWTFPVDPGATPENLDWDRWLGQARKIPFNPERYFSWHKYYDYNSGIIGNLLPHRFHPLMLATGNPEFPRRVVCTGTRAVSTDREITDTTHLLAEFPSGLTLAVAGSTVNQVGLPEMLRGRKGTLYFASQGNKLEFKPEQIFAEEADPETFNDPQPTESIERLEKHFFDCVRSGKTPLANIDLAIRAQTVLCLAEMSERLGLALFFDAGKREIKTADGKVVPALTYDTVVPKIG